MPHAYSPPYMPGSFVGPVPTTNTVAMPFKAFTSGIGMIFPVIVFTAIRRNCMASLPIQTNYIHQAMVARGFTVPADFVDMVHVVEHFTLFVRLR